MKIKTINSLDKFLDILKPRFENRGGTFERTFAYCSRVEHVRLILPEWEQLGISIEGGAFLSKLLGRSWGRIIETVFELIKPHSLVTKKLDSDRFLMEKYKRGELYYYDILAIAESEQQTNSVDEKR